MESVHDGHGAVDPIAVLVDVLVGRGHNVPHLTNDGSAGKNTNKPIENHKGAVDVVDRFWILADLCGRLQGKIEASNIPETCKRRVLMKIIEKEMKIKMKMIDSYLI